MKSFIILCGGRSKRMGKDKGLIILNKKPMITHVLDTISNIADEVVLVLRDQEQFEDYGKILKKYNHLKVVIDKIKDQGPLMGILTGLEEINSDYAQILPCDSPFISPNFVLKMFESIEHNEFDAIVPIWDDGHIEPLHSIYKKNSIYIIKDLFKRDIKNVSALIDNLNVKYIDVEKLDETTMSFQNINSINDFKNK